MHPTSLPLSQTDTVIVRYSLNYHCILCREHSIGWWWSCCIKESCASHSSTSVVSHW